MKTANDIKNEVLATLGDHARDFDVDGIVEELKSILAFDARAGYASIDTLEPADYSGIIARHDTA